MRKVSACGRVTAKLLAAFALAALAMSVSAASATAQETPIEVVNEDTEVACNPCVVELEGTSAWRPWPLFGFASSCHDVLEAEIWHDGTGHVYQWVATPNMVGVTCSNQPCAAEEELEFELTDAGEIAPGTSHVWARPCFFWGSVSGPDEDRHCDVEFIIDEVASHVYRFSTQDVDCPKPNIRFDAVWTTIDDGVHDSIEIVHL